MQLNFRDCKAKIRQVDAHSTLASGVVVQVLGELSNNNRPMRRFMQTFVLAPQSAKKYYVYNDIFRYQVQNYTQIGVSNLIGGSKSGSQIGGSKSGSQIEVPNRGSQSGSLNWGP
jgi:hypothetical protein